MKRTLVLSSMAMLLGSCSGNSGSDGFPTNPQGGATGAATGGAASNPTPTGGAASNPTPTGGAASNPIPTGGVASNPTPTGGAAQGGQALGGGVAIGGAATGGQSLSTGGAANATATGGVTASGGAATTGGTKAIGGNTSPGGTSTSVGTTVTGGTSSATGGAKATGGTSPALGGAATGGVASGGNKATGGTSTATGGTATGGNDLLVPATGALLGAFIGSGTIEATETQIGRKWAIQLGYFDWAFDFTSFAQNNITAGRIPYVTVEPWNVTLDAIANGSQDATIQSRATSIKGLTGKVMLRFAHEMNGNWYPWDGFHNGANTTAPPKYIAAYRHIKDVFVAAGVTNVLWVFCPNMNSVPGDAWNQWANYYPGDGYVDWMCYDGYDWGGTSFTSITSGIYSQFVAKNNKPIMLGETSTMNAEKATWINAIIPTMKSQFPMLKAFVWFHVNKENDWRYDSTATSLSAFISMAKDPYFNP